MRTYPRFARVVRLILLGSVILATCPERITAAADAPKDLQPWNGAALSDWTNAKKPVVITDMTKRRALDGVLPAQAEEGPLDDDPLRDAAGFRRAQGHGDLVRLRGRPAGSEDPAGREGLACDLHRVSGAHGHVGEAGHRQGAAMVPTAFATTATPANEEEGKNHRGQRVPGSGCWPTRSRRRSTRPRPRRSTRSSIGAPARSRPASRLISGWRGRPGGGCPTRPGGCRRCRRAWTRSSRRCG